MPDGTLGRERAADGRQGGTGWILHPPAAFPVGLA
jgi:hypothetical protein